MVQLITVSGTSSTIKKLEKVKFIIHPNSVICITKDNSLTVNFTAKENASSPVVKTHALLFNRVNLRLDVLKMALRSINMSLGSLIQTLKKNHSLSINLPKEPILASSNAGICRQMYLHKLTIKLEMQRMTSMWKVYGKGNIKHLSKVI